MLADDKASAMLDHQVVNQRLHASMTRWLIGLFAPESTFEQTIAVQQRTGEVHARIGVPMDLVTSGARLLNRRYFPSVAKREIALAQRQHSVFGLLSVEIDHFSRTRDALGLAGADAVLSAVADSLLDSVRAGDFVFRVGEARFLVLLVETSAEALPRVSEGLREQIETTRIRTASRASTAVTVSLGAALFDGHPDYQRLLDRADAALKVAQAAGFNRCAMDPVGVPMQTVLP